MLPFALEIYQKINKYDKIMNTEARDFKAKFKEYLFNTANHKGEEKNIEEWYLKQTIKFIEDFENKQKRFAYGQFDEKQIAYSAWIEGRKQALNLHFVSGMLPDVKRKIDLAYLTGVFNVAGIDGLQKEIERLKELGKHPHDIFDEGNYR